MVNIYIFLHLRQV